MTKSQLKLNLTLLLLITSFALAGCLKQNSSTTSARKNPNKGKITGNNINTKLSEADTNKTNGTANDTSKSSTTTKPVGPIIETEGQNNKDQKSITTTSQTSAFSKQAKCSASTSESGAWFNETTPIDNSNFNVDFNKDGVYSLDVDGLKYAFEVVVKENILSEIRFLDKKDFDSFEFAATSVQKNKDNTIINGFELKYNNNIEVQSRNSIEPFSLVQIEEEDKSTKLMITDGFRYNEKFFTMIANDAKVSLANDIYNLSFSGSIIPELNKSAQINLSILTHKISGAFDSEKHKSFNMTCKYI